MSKLTTTTTKTSEIKTEEEPESLKRTGSRWAKLPKSLKTIWTSTTVQTTSSTVEDDANPEQNERIMTRIRSQFSDIDLASLLPEGMSIKEYWSEVESKVKSEITTRSTKTQYEDEEKLAARLLQSGHKKKHPIVIVPGFTTTVLFLKYLC